MHRELLALGLGLVLASDTIRAEPPLAASAPASKAAPAALVTQFAAARAQWTSACWDTANPASRKRGSYIAVLAFDATGKQVVSGVSEVRGSSDPNVAQCLRGQLLNLSIPAADAPATIEHTFDFP